METKLISCLKGLAGLLTAWILQHYGMIDSQSAVLLVVGATAYINQERFGVEFEDRINSLVNIDPDKTAFMSMVQKSECYRNRVDWQTHVLDTANANNSGVEGANVTFAPGDYTAPTGLFNYTQIPQRPFSASFTYDAVRKPGMGNGSLSGFNAEKARKLKALKLDMNAAMLSNNQRQQPIPESTQAGLVRGIERWITTNRIDASTQANKNKYGGSILSRKMFEELAKLAVDEGGAPETILVNSFNRLRINEFVGDPTRDVDSQGRKIMRMVDVITSIAGDQTIIFERQIAQSTLLMLEMKYWEMRWLRAPQSYIAGLLGSRTEGWVEAEFTLIAYAQESSGAITNLQS